MALLLSMDGCRGGWCGVRCGRELTEGFAFEVFGTLEEAWLSVAAQAGSELAVDMPIGLSWAGFPSRPCDQGARRLLGKGLGSRVFPTPARAALAASSHAEAVRLNRLATGKGLSVQAFHLLPKIREVDTFMSLFPDATIREVHPELSFMRLNGGLPVRARKKSREGFYERWTLLEAHVPEWMDALDNAISRTRRSIAQPDDWLDAAAIAAAWRKGQGKWYFACDPPVRYDEAGRPMQIAF